MSVYCSFTKKPKGKLLRAVWLFLKCRDPGFSKTLDEALICMVQHGHSYIHIL